MTKLNLAEAFRIAVEVHGDQRDRSGEPYMGHVCRVMAQMETDEERAVAILHDTIEDSAASESAGIAEKIVAAYGTAVADAVRTLTKPKGVAYMAYVSTIGANPLALKVKFADLRDNMSEARLGKLPLELRERLKAKYAEAYEYLRGAYNP